MVRALKSGTIAVGDAVEVFVRPEVAMLARSAAELPADQPRHAGEVQSLLFDGANSAVLLQEDAHPPRISHRAAADRAVSRISSPHEKVAFSFDPIAGGVLCGARRRGGAGCLTSPDYPLARRACALGLLLAPALLWLGALIVLPHVDLAVLSFRERVGPAPIRAEPRAVQDFLHRAAVLARVRAHGGDVGRSPRS